MGGLMSLVNNWLGTNDETELVIKDSLCFGRRVKNNHCFKCADICPREAITIDKRISLDRQKCSGCGACTVVCPSHNLTLPNSYSKLIEDILVKSKTTNELTFSCKQGYSSQHIVVPCLVLVSFEVILLAFAMGVSKLSFSGCDRCEPGLLEESERNILTAKKYLKDKNSGLQVIFKTGDRENDKEFGSVTRRDFFEAMSKNLKNSVKEVIPTIGEKDCITRKQVMDLVRKKLNGQLDPIYANKIKSMQDVQKCGACTLCQKLCPNEAWLKKAENLEHKPEKCWACGNCIAVCMKNNIKEG